MQETNEDISIETKWLTDGCILKAVKQIIVETDDAEAKTVLTLTLDDSCTPFELADGYKARMSFK